MFDMSGLKLSRAIKAGELSSEEATASYIKRIEKTDGLLNAFVRLCAEKAIVRSREVQKQIDDGNIPSDLAGVPIALKDNISTADIETSCASKMLKGYKPVFNATVVDKLERAGMIVIGKLNMDEFAMGGSSETGVFGEVHNPWDVSRVAGGSSGGSAAAVAAREIPVSLGTDTGGSIRQPCSFCGVTGIKPTYGAVSRYGAVAFASSLDQIGPLGRDIDDCAALLSIISGPDEKDSTCVIEKPFNFSNTGNNRLNGIAIGIPRNYFASGIDPEVKDAVLMAAGEIEAAGGHVEEFEMPLADYVIPAYYIIGSAEASSNLLRFDGLKYGYRAKNAKTLNDVYRISRSEGFGIEVKRRIMMGSFVLSSGYYDAYYKKALQARSLIKNAYSKLFEKFDMILSPTAPSTAYKIGENIDDPMKMYMGDMYTASVNMAGLPSIALPCGFDRLGMPIGFQLIGNAFSEEKLIGVGRIYQSRTDYHAKIPGGVLL
ncbi:MAG: Asp-tRNA(Asn)/Glu-tRNA(Gln) amidotransferase subunit GatA [Oscillospiraceae bacterium]|nr:Asp-tRNA(Asn)/Glu-tRNA(Gln) amidotransferase subunit GatA [Oscillospiraceae bacterium]